MKSGKVIGPKKSIWRRKVLWAGVLVLIAAVAAAWYFLGAANGVQAGQNVSGAVVNTTAVSRGDLRVTVTGSGVLAAGQTAELAFSTSGTVASVEVKLGDLVTAGQVLATLDEDGSLKTDIASIKLDLLQAQQTLAGLQQNADVALAEAYQAWVSAKSAYQDALTAQERTAYARCSQEVNTKYKGALDLAQANLDKLGLRSYGTDAWINAKNNYDSALANYTYCISYTASEKTNAGAELQVAKTAVDKAEAKLKTLQQAAGIDPDEMALAESKVNALQAKLDTAEAELKGLTLTAPFAGRVISLASGAGTRAGTGAFIKIADVYHPIVEVSVDESDLDSFVTGSPATITFDALPDQEYQGTVTLVDPVLTTYGSYRVLKGMVTLDETAARTVKDLPLSLNGTVIVTYKEVKNVLLVPVTALKSLGADGYQVLLAADDGTTRPQQVQVGLTGSEYAEVLSGLTEGDKIVTIVENASSTNSQMPGDGMMPPMDGGGPPPMP